MDDQREYEGKDLEEAIEAASSSLKIPESELHYEIVEQGRRGLFGIGAKSVRIRIMPPVEPLGHGDLLGSPGPSRAGDRRKGRGRGAAQDGKRDRAPDPQRPSRNRNKPVEARQAEPAEEEAPREPVPEKEAVEVVGTVKRIFELAGFEIEAQVASLEGGVTVEIDGTDRDLVTQKDAELLHAVQLLLNRMCRRAWPEVPRVHLHCNGERKRRDEDVVELAKEVAEQVTRTGRAKRLHPMNAYERRLVHLTVRELGGLVSSSEGDGSLKRIRITRGRRAGNSGRRRRGRPRRPAPAQEPEA